MDLSGKLVVVVGLGQSGIAAARVCAAHGARLVLTDSQPADRLSPDVRTLPGQVVAGGHEGVPFATAHLIIVSPGVPPLPELMEAEQAGVEVIGELELGWRFARAPAVCVGGTNGKSTVTTLVAGMLGTSASRVFAGANLGTPLCAAIEQDWDWLVLEASSFQLERAPSFRPRVSVLLNITDDHLDRYPNFDAYADAKGNAFVNQGPDDVAVVPHGDARCVEQARRGRGRIMTFGPGGDYDVLGQTIVERASGERFDLSDTSLHGAHNALNAAASLAAVRACGVATDMAREGLRRFAPLKHRMARAGQLNGVVFYDDSKGTNVGAAVTALLGVREPRAVLIAGGRDKLGAYDTLVEAVAAKARAVVLIGEAADRIAAAIGGRAPVARASSVEEAVERAYALALPGDAVLLSPACSSFDMFKSYAERGDRFVAAVHALGQRLGQEVS